MWCSRTFPEGICLNGKSHGNAYPSAGLDGAACRDQLLSSPGVDTAWPGRALPRGYRGCTASRPQRGTLRTRPAARPRDRTHAALARRRRLARTRRVLSPLAPAATWAITENVVLELAEDIHTGIACWNHGWSAWAHLTVAFAYDQRYSVIRAHMHDGGISRPKLILVAAALARYADFRTGRNARPTNARLAADTGLSIRHVQRGRQCLRLLGVATEVLRGRQRTRTERFASWRLGDRARGWASVWALHEDAQLVRAINTLSPHPLSGPLSKKHSPYQQLTTHSRRPHGRRKHGATRRARPDERGLALAQTWRSHPNSPPWARRHSAAAWAAVLAGPAHHQWTARDLNQLITDWLGITGHRIPDRPAKPIGLLGAVLVWHGRDNLDDRPSAQDQAREAHERASRAAQRRAEADDRRQRQSIVLPAEQHPARQAARAVAAAAAQRAQRRRIDEAAADTAELAKKIESIRACDAIPGTSDYR